MAAYMYECPGVSLRVPARLEYRPKKPMVSRTAPIKGEKQRDDEPGMLVEVIG